MYGVTDMTLDDARRAFPKLGLAIYALDPGGPMTLEVHTVDGQVFTFDGPTEADLVARAFPSLQPAPIEAPQPTEMTNVFD